MADPQTDQGFLPGLLGKVGNWFGSYDPQAEYGGLLSDDATKQQFRLRALGAVASSMAQNSMPVPYKGGMPWGSFLGAAGGAAATSGDSLIKARLEEAQQQQALATVGLSRQQVELMQAALPGLKSLISTGQASLGAGGSGTGTGTDGKPLTGPAKILAGNAAQGGGIGAGQLYGFLRSFDYPGVAPATPQEASFLTGNAKIESNFNPDTEHDGAFLAKKGLPPGYGLWGDNADRLSAMRKDSWVGPTDNVPWQQQAIWQLQELRKSDQGSAVNAAKSSQDLANLSIDYLRPDTKTNDGYRAERRDAINTYLTNPPDAQTASTGDQPPPADLGPQTASTGDQPPPADLGPQTASGGAYSVPPPPGPPPKPGEYAIPVRAGNVPPPPVAPPMAPSAAPSGGLLKLPDPTSAAPPQLATPPAAGAPGPVTGLLGQQPTQQVAAADAPQLSPAAAAVLQGINRQQAGRGLLASGSVAGGNAVPTSEPPAVAQQSQLPHTGAAGAAELAGLLQQPPPAGATPTATPYTNAPPITGQGAPAPGPAPGPAPPAPPPGTSGPQATPSVPMRQGPAPIGPPPQLPPMPTQMPAAGNLPNVQPTPQQMIAQGVSGLMSMSGHPAPGWIDDLAKMPAQMALEQFKAWVGAQTTMMTARDAEMVKARMAPYIAAAEAAARAQQEGVRPNRLFPQPDGTFRQAPGEPYHRAGPPDIYGNPTEVMVYPSGDPNVPEKVVSIPGTTGQGTYRTEEEKASAARDAALADRFTTQGVAANDIRPTISMAKSILANTPTGIGAPYQAALNEMLAKVSGNPALAEKTGNYQQLASQLAEVRRGMMQGEPQGDLKAIPGEFASVGTSPQALPRMLSDISGMADYRAARLQSMTQYADPKIHPENQGSTRGFASWWSQNFNPYAFMLNRMDPNERATALYRIAQQPGGHQEIDRIVAQDRLGRSWGYIPNFGPGQ